MTVYILYSEILSKFYIGQTADLEERIRRHNNGLAGFTKKGIPWDLIWSLEVESRTEALKLERKIKKRGAKRFLQDMAL